MNTKFGFQLLGSSDAFQQACVQIERIAKVDATVLIEGEKDTGKEMAARAVHYLGHRRERAFVPVNCGALAKALVESELFGHERSAFSDAKVASMGLVHEAGGGTLFLDEVDALSLKAQAAMLRFLQDGNYRRVGGSATQQSDVRIIVASNTDLHELTERRLFRKDLLYRINVLPLRMPSLRERGEDALELARIFLTRLGHHYERPSVQFTLSAISHIRRHNWPGNVRELENVVQRAFLLSDGNEIDFPNPLGPLDQSSPAPSTTTEAAIFKNAKLTINEQSSLKFRHQSH